MRNQPHGPNFFVRFAVLGAFVLGVLPGPGGAVLLFAQAQKASADAGAKPAKVSMAPIRAFLRRSKRLHAAGKLDLSKPRELTVEGDRQEDGTLTAVQITGASAADAEFRRVALDFVASLTESRVLQPLDAVSHVRMTFSLDAETFSLRTASDTPSEARAEEMARGYRLLINAGRLLRRGTDEGALLGGMKVSSNGKQLLMNLDMPREQMGNILLRQIGPN